ncbi:unnamed protein product [Clavelina lepadiformis]|uniref:Sushi domain-containing protein n=1 Tax=Clavelina lepadiformis TaxID=159417 RepID=A0ABP0GKV1_CLALP
MKGGKTRNCYSRVGKGCFVFVLIFAYLPHHCVSNEDKRLLRSTEASFHTDNRLEKTERVLSDELSMKETYHFSVGNTFKDTSLQKQWVRNLSILRLDRGIESDIGDDSTRRERRPRRVGKGWKKKRPVERQRKIKETIKQSFQSLHSISGHQGSFIATHLLCPVWPDDSNLLFNCTNGRELRSRCAVNCAPGYRFERSERNYRRCKLTRKGRRRKNHPYKLEASWSGRDRDFRCVPTCKKLDDPNHGYVRCSPSADDGSSVSLTVRSCVTTCDPGYIAVHPGVRHCQVDGSWSGEETTCEPRTKTKQHLFVRHQTLHCGHIHGLTTYTFQGVTYLAAADESRNIVRIYKWDNDLIPPSFSVTTWQILRVEQPLQLEAIPRGVDGLVLAVGNQNNTSLFRANDRGRLTFYYKTRKIILTAGNQTTGIDLWPLKGDIYRCKTENKRGRAVVLVQKLDIRRGKRDIFRRVMRRKMKPGETTYQCSMFAEDDLLHIAVSLNKPNGRGKIIVGAPHNGRMRIRDTLSDRDLRNLSDITGFRTRDGSQYIVAGQTTSEGRCFVYRRLRHYQQAETNT